MGQRHLNAAKEFFALNEHCTDFVEIQQDLSGLHKVLAFFESDPDRRLKIHKRRVDILETPLKELSVSHYLLICRQLYYELAEIYESMMDAKLDWMNRDEAARKTPQTVSRINGYIDKAINFFITYLESLADAKTKKMPETFYADSTRPALVAYFHLARLWDKFIVSETSAERKIKNKLQTMAYFQRVVDYCDRNPDAENVVSGELPLCREMVKLLPIQIEKIRRQIK